MSAETAPRKLKIIGISLMALVLAGAVYLIAVRGEAIIVDLSALAAGVWCF